MCFLYAFLLSQFLLASFVMSCELGDLSATNKLTRICNSVLGMSIILGWIAPVALGFVDHTAILIIALFISTSLIVASIITLSKNLFFGICNLVCWGSYLALLITCCSSYENPNLTTISADYIVPDYLPYYP